MYYAPEWKLARTLEELEAARAAEAGTWVVYTLPGYIAQTRPELLEALERDYEHVRSFPGTLPHGEMIVRVRRPEASAP
jgi:hypothetical protein